MKLTAVNLTHFFDVSYWKLLKVLLSSFQNKNKKINNNTLIMSSVELWFDDDEEEDTFLEIARRRKQLRDASNPLELEEKM